MLETAEGVAQNWVPRYQIQGKDLRFVSCWAAPPSCALAQHNASSDCCCCAEAPKSFAAAVRPWNPPQALISLTRKELLSSNDTRFRLRTESTSVASSSDSIRHLLLHRKIGKQELRRCLDTKPACDESTLRIKQDACMVRSMRMRQQRPSSWAPSLLDPLLQLQTGKTALLDRQTMGPQPELHQGPELTDFHCQLKVGLKAQTTRAAKPMVID